MAGTSPAMTRFKFRGYLRDFIHSSSPFGSGFGKPALSEIDAIWKWGSEVGWFERVRLQSASPKLPTLRFRGKIVLGFAAVLGISAVSMGIAWLGFERISDGVASYHHSVAEADLARNIDRELISYRSLARYYVVTAREDDAKAALTAEASLRDAILQSMKGTANPARLEQIVKLEREFRIFTKIFADILKVKRESALLTQNQLTRGGTMLRYKFDDLASNAAEAELPAVELGAKQVTSQYLAVIGSPIPTRPWPPARLRVSNSWKTRCARFRRPTTRSWPRSRNFPVCSTNTGNRSASWSTIRNRSMSWLLKWRTPPPPSPKARTQ
jgi:CHASE3 domain sensor protein